jgi:hypothetical protein
MSDFIFLFRSGNAEAERALGTKERAQKSLDVWLSWIRELENQGQLKNPGQPLSRTGKVVRGSDDASASIVTDGPFAEAKDIVLGFIVIQARDLTQAAELARGCPIVAGGGSVEVRPVDHAQLESLS